MAKYISISGFCSTTKKPLGIQLRVDNGYYSAVGSFSVSAGMSTTADSADCSGKIVPDGFHCKHCQNTCIITCANCGAILCVAAQAPSVVCPSCNGTTNITWVDSVEEVSDSTIKGRKQ